MNDNREQILYLLKKHPKISQAGLSLATGLIGSEVEQMLIDLHCSEDIHYENNTKKLRRKEIKETEPHSISELDYVLHSYLQYASGAVLGDIAVALELSRERALILLSAHEARGLITLKAGTYTSCILVPINKLHVKQDQSILSLETPLQFQLRQKRENVIALCIAFVALIILFLLPRQASTVTKESMLLQLSEQKITSEHSDIVTVAQRRATIQKTRSENEVSSCKTEWKESPTQKCAIQGTLYTQQEWNEKEGVQ